MDKRLVKTFEDVYAEFSDALFRFVLYRVGSREEALDIVEETYLRLWQTLMKEGVREPRAFLFKAARNLVIDWYRKKKSVPLQDFGDEAGEEKVVFMDMFESFVPGADTLLEARLVIDKIKALDPIYREVIYLRYVEELTPKEISEITGQSPNLISVRINRGTKLLKKLLHM